MRRSYYPRLVDHGWSSALCVPRRACSSTDSLRYAKDPRASASLRGLSSSPTPKYPPLPQTSQKELKLNPYIINP